MSSRQNLLVVSILLLLIHFSKIGNATKHLNQPQITTNGDQKQHSASYHNPKSSQKRKERAFTNGKTVGSINSLSDTFNSKYDFNYKIDGGGNFFGHSERRTETETSGEYFVVLPDFRRQIVKYYVDASGYHATVSYEPIVVPIVAAASNNAATGGLNLAKSNFPKRKFYKRVVRRRVAKRRLNKASSASTKLTPKKIRAEEGE